MKRIIVALTLLALPTIVEAGTVIGMQAYSSANRVSCSATNVVDGKLSFNRAKHIYLNTRGYGNYSATYTSVYLRCYQTLAPSTAAVIKTFVNNTSSEYFPLSERLFTNLD